jgi:hypothetical protein
MPNDTPSAILKDLRTYDSNDTWHMLKADSRGGDSFPANLLVTSLMRLNVENQPYWGAWSSKHPGYAATLWPTIQAMAMSNLYHEIPEVLRFAEGYTGPGNDFDHELLKTIHEKIQQRKDRYGHSHRQASRIRGDRRLGPSSTMAQGPPHPGHRLVNRNL